MRIFRRLDWDLGCMLGLRWWEGVVFLDQCSRRATVCPVGLNLVCRAVYLVWLWLRFPLRESLLEQREADVRRRLAWLDGELARTEGYWSEASMLGTRSVVERGDGGDMERTVFCSRV